MNTYKPKRSGVKLKIVEAGEEFNSIAECANYLGVDVSWLGRITRGYNNLHTCHGLHIVRLDDPNYDETNLKPFGRTGTGKRIRIIETGEEFNTIAECAKSINGSIGTIHDVLNNKRSRVTHKGYHFELI